LPPVIGGPPPSFCRSRPAAEDSAAAKGAAAAVFHSSWDIALTALDGNVHVCAGGHSGHGFGLHAGLPPTEIVIIDLSEYPEKPWVRGTKQHFFWYPFVDHLPECKQSAAPANTVAVAPVAPIASVVSIPPFPMIHESILVMMVAGGVHVAVVHVPPVTIPFRRRHGAEALMHLSVEGILFVLRHAVDGVSHPHQLAGGV
jgi:hypothetical protein